MKRTTYRDICSKTDRRAYWAYVRVCLAAQCSPLSAHEWMLSTERSVEEHVRFWREKETRGLHNALFFESEDHSDHNTPWAKKARTHRPDSAQLAEIGELMKAPRPGFVIGELRSDGLVHPETSVRSQTRTKGGGPLVRPRVIKPFVRSSIKKWRISAISCVFSWS
jgi:hypothetical protein